MEAAGSIEGVCGRPVNPTSARDNAGCPGTPTSQCESHTTTKTPPPRKKTIFALSFERGICCGRAWARWKALRNLPSVDLSLGLWASAMSRSKARADIRFAKSIRRSYPGPDLILSYTGSSKPSRPGTPSGSGQVGSSGMSRSREAGVSASIFN